jgi:prophage regulatory protein
MISPSPAFADVGADQMAKLIKLPDVEAISALRCTNIYGAIKVGLFPPPVKVTARASAWVEDEVLAINAARIAGQSDHQIRKLVADLIDARAQILPALLAARRVGHSAVAA